jgi:hypothetical protein
MQTHWYEADHGTCNNCIEPEIIISRSILNNLQTLQIEILVFSCINYLFIYVVYSGLHNKPFLRKSKNVFVTSYKIWTILNRHRQNLVSLTIFTLISYTKFRQNPYNVFRNKLYE